MDLDTSFGRWLRQRRRALDLTQDDLARRAGCAVICGGVLSSLTVTLCSGPGLPALSTAW